MAGKCCGDNQMPDILVNKTFVKAKLIDTKIGTRTNGNDVFAGDCLVTCDDLETTTETLQSAITNAVAEAASNLNQGTNLPADATDCTKPVTACGVTRLLNADGNSAIKDAVAQALKDKSLGDTAYRLALAAALLSKQAGNRIELRPDGIGVFDVAPPNLSVQYVDAVGGDDTNPGTKAAPLRTVSRALHRILAGTQVGDYTIALKSGQTHLVNERSYSLPRAGLTFVTYDDPKYGLSTDSKSCAGYWVWQASDFQCATLSFRNHLYLGYPNTTLITANSIRLYGVNVDHTDERATLPGTGQFAFETLGSMYVSGGDVTLGTGRSLARPASLRIQYTNIELQGTAKLLDAVYGPSLYINAPNAFAGVEKPCTNGPSYTIRNSTGYGVITPANSGFAYSASRKQLLNGMTNWDMFAGT